MLRLRRFKDLLTQHWTSAQKYGFRCGYLPGHSSRGRLWALALGVLLCTSQGPGFAQRAIAASPPTPAPVLSQTASPAQAFQRGQSLYAQGQYQQAIAPLEEAIRAYQQTGAPLSQAIALGNLSLVYQKLGQWSPAQAAIAQSLTLLPEAKADARTQANLLDIQGSLQLETGQAEQALATWQQSAQTYGQLKDMDGLWRNRINQAQALRVLGFYRRALTLLEDIPTQGENPEENPDEKQGSPVAQATRNRLLGDALRLTGRPAEARQRLETSLALAKQLNDPQLISLAYLSLANTARAEGDAEAALILYQQAAGNAATPDSLVQIQINQLTLFLQEQRWDNANQLWQTLSPQFMQLTASHTGIYSKIHGIQAVLGADVAEFQIPSSQLEPLINQTIADAKQVADLRAEAHALGTLGQLREREGQSAAGIDLTRQALQLSQGLDAPDISYRLNWQLGRLLNQQGETTGAIAAYDAAIADLQALRRDLVSINRDIQFSFKESVEPVYRESVSLLVKASDKTPEDQNSNLNKARERIEALQLAELDNFFREACLDGQTVLLDKVVDQDNPTTAIVYPIILADQLEVIVKIPGQPLQHHSVAASATTVQALLRDLRKDLPDITQSMAVRQRSSQVYQWLLEPIETALVNSQVDTLVFVLDGAFRNVPMAVLYDGKQYLIEKYAIGVSLGLQLQQPRAIFEEKLNVLAAGLIDPPQDFRRFPSLPEIEQEFQLLDATGIANEQLLNQAFTRSNITTKVKQDRFNVVHLATHGQFSSQASETFILAADGPIHVGELDQLLRDRTNSEALELLILSACQTAAGDDRAALGLAGIAVKAGARSTMASLWQVDDRSTALLMGQFYQQLSEANVSKAEALRRSQLALLNDEDLRAPAYWAPYVVVGNWL